MCVLFYKKYCQQTSQIEQTLTLLRNITLDKEENTGNGLLKSIWYHYCYCSDDNHYHLVVVLATAEQYCKWHSGKPRLHVICGVVLALLLRVCSLLVVYQSKLFLLTTTNRCCLNGVCYRIITKLFLFVYVSSALLSLVLLDIVYWTGSINSGYFLYGADRWQRRA